MADTFEQYASDNVMVPPGDRWHVGRQFDLGGMQFHVLEATVSTAEAVASIDLGTNLPAGAMVWATEMKFTTAITLTTATKVGLGDATTTADPDKYLLSGTTMDAGTATSALQSASVESAIVDLAIFACDAAGDAAGTIDAGTIQVRITYAVIEGL